MPQLPWEAIGPPLGLPLADAQVEGLLALPNGASIWHAVLGKPIEQTLSAGEVPVVFLTGGLSHSEYYGHQVRYLIPDHTVLVFDHRGHGRTPLGDDTDITYNKLEDDLMLLLDHYHIPKAALIGWSDGAMVAWTALLNHLDRVDRIFSFGAVDDCEKNDGDAIDEYESVKQYFAQSQREWSEFHPGEDADSNFAPYYKLWKKEPKWTASMFDHVPVRWEAEAAPVVWVVAADHDDWMPNEVTERLRQFIRNSSFLELPNSGHLAFVQAPEIFNSMVKHFLMDV
ncbi:putative AB hydrolase-1 domain-containing protein [Seiridium unicorne]|uniref:AB hydrolase-1 domain-containing protein n=1 Tax=Seiridium unicorne TaxID=138068 RepID=A0ABR2VEI6_9PEZI